MTDLASPDGLSALHTQCFATPRPWSSEEFSSLLTQKFVFIVFLEAGFAIGRAVAGEVELLTLAVSPSARRTGQGRALMELFETEAKSRGATESFLEVAADNEAAIALYVSHGYCESGLRKNYYTHPDGSKISALVMKKDL